jgi:hypothetical protein
MAGASNCEVAERGCAADRLLNRVLCALCPIDHSHSAPALPAAVKVVLVADSVADELVPRVVAGVKKMSVGM